MKTEFNHYLTLIYPFIRPQTGAMSEVKAGLLTPMKRSDTPEEVSYAVRLLADPQAAYITNQLLIVDGGNSIPEDRAWKP